MPSNTTTAILEIAAENHAVCTRRELLDAGISRAAIDRRVADGTLQIVSRGVFEATIVADEHTPLVRALAAVSKSVLSRRTAGPILGFALPSVSEVHVTGPYGSGRSHRLPGIVVHETRSLPAIDIVLAAEGFPLTSPARTIVDLAAELGHRRLGHLVRTQVATGAPTIQELQACFLRLAKKGRPGIAALRGLLDDLAADARPLPQSELEARVWNGLRRVGLAGFAPQFRPPWFDGRRGVVDFAHRAAAVILEADGRRWHARHESMVDDRRRDRLAATNGWLVVRLMWEDLIERPDATFAELADIAATRLAEGAA